MNENRKDKELTYSVFSSDYNYKLIADNYMLKSLDIESMDKMIKLLPTTECLNTDSIKILYIIIGKVVEKQIRFSLPSFFSLLSVIITS